MEKGLRWGWKEKDKSTFTLFSFNLADAPIFVHPRYFFSLLQFWIRAGKKCPPTRFAVEVGLERNEERIEEVEKAKRPCYRPVLYVIRVLHRRTRPCPPLPREEARGRASEKGSFPVPIERRKNFHAVTISFRPPFYPWNILNKRKGGKGWNGLRKRGLEELALLSRRFTNGGCTNGAG